MVSCSYDTTLGGFEWDQRLKAHMLDAFVKKNEGKLKGDPSTNARTLAKLLKEAQRIRGVLSANSDVYPQVLKLYDSALQLYACDLLVLRHDG